MRNPTTTLSATDTHAAHLALNTLVQAGEAAVIFTAAKRDDRSALSTRTGRVLSFQGDSFLSTASVRVDTPDGERSFNLYLISDIVTI
jgi:hypothetical protein